MEKSLDRFVVDQTFCDICGGQLHTRVLDCPAVMSGSLAAVLSEFQCPFCTSQRIKRALDVVSLKEEGSNFGY